MLPYGENGKDPLDRKRLEQLERRYRHISRRLSRPDLQREIEVEESDDPFADLMKNPNSKRFLGFYSEDGLRLGLEQYGFLDAIRARGLGEIVVRFDLQDPYQHRLLIYCDGEAIPANRLCELRVRVVHRPEAYLFERELGDDPQDFLYIEGLFLQNPRKEFLPDRPRLPGQQHPGLGVSYEVFVLLKIMAERLRFAGVLNVPAYYHNAYLYNIRSRFLEPEVEGRFRALRRDLGERPLAEATWAVHTDCVIDVDTGEPFQWEGHEQLFAVRHAMVRYFGSTRYKRTRRDVAAGLNYRVDEQRLARELERLTTPGAAGPMHDPRPAK